MFYRHWDRNMIFLGKRLCFTSPFSWRSSPQGSDIRSCLKCPMLRTCCSPSPLCSTWSRWTSTVLGRTLAHLVGHLDGRKGARTWSQCVCGDHSTLLSAPWTTMWQSSGGTGMALWTYNLRPSGTPHSARLGPSHLCTPRHSDRRDVEISMRRVVLTL